MGFWHRTIGPRGNHNRRLFSRRLNLIMLLLLLFRLVDMLLVLGDVCDRQVTPRGFPNLGPVALWSVPKPR